MRKVMFALAIMAGVFMAVGPASAQCTYRMIDVGRPMGYLSGPCNGGASGYAGAYPAHPNSAAQAHPTKDAFVIGRAHETLLALQAGAQSVSQPLAPEFWLLLANDGNSLRQI